MQTDIQKAIMSSLQRSDAGANGASRRARFAPSGESSSLPCLFNNNSITSKNEEKTPQNASKEANASNHQKQATAAFLNISSFLNPGSSVKSIEELEEMKAPHDVAFLTLTMPDGVRDPKEFQRRFNSLQSNILRPRYGKSNICTVVEAHKSGALHVHILVRLGWKIRTDGNLVSLALYAAADNLSNVKARSEMRRRAAKAADDQLRKEWKYLRMILGNYGFGRHRLEPIRGNAAGMARYCTKYFTKGLTDRPAHLKGARLLRFPSSCRAAYSSFSWNTPAGRVWREKLKALANGLERMVGQECSDVQGITAILGRSWCFRHKDKICAISVSDFLNLEDFVSDRPRNPEEQNKWRFSVLEVLESILPR